MPSDKLNIQQGIRHEVSKTLMPGDMGIDGKKWAEEFMKLLKSVPLTEDLAQVWFANAIMMGYDHGRKTPEQEQNPAS